MRTDVGAIRREHIEAFITDQLARLAPTSAANRPAEQGRQPALDAVEGTKCTLPLEWPGLKTRSDPA